jgi:amidase
MVPQAPSSDTAGWFSRSAKTLARVGQILYKADIPERLPKRLLIAHDAFASSDDTVQAALAPKLKRLSELFDEVTEVDMAPDGLVQWSKAQRTIQPTEGWHTFNKWIDQHNPRMSYTVARNLFLASQISQSDLDAAQLVKQQAITRMKTLLPHGTLLCLPTTPFCAPKVGLPVHQTDHLRTQISVLCCHGGLTGVPQVSIPGGTVGEDHAPVGLSIVAGHNYDTDLLAVALALESKHV